jgi:hypothetical protein
MLQASATTSKGPGSTTTPQGGPTHLLCLLGATGDLVHLYGHSGGHIPPTPYLTKAPFSEKVGPITLVDPKVGKGEHVRGCLFVITEARAAHCAGNGGGGGEGKGNHLALNCVAAFSFAAVAANGAATAILVQAPLTARSCRCLLHLDAPHPHQRQVSRHGLPPAAAAAAALPRLHGQHQLAALGCPHSPH